MLLPSDIQIFGEYPEELPASDEYLTLNFSPASAPRKGRWAHYGISADFLGDYFAAFFPGDAIADSKINRKDTIKGVVSYIANELLENAVKYSDESLNLPISITLYLYQQELLFQVINYANLVIVRKYQNFIRELLNSDPEEFYIRQLEKTALEIDESHLGLVTMINDYSARFGWKFHPLNIDSTVMRVYVTARLII